MLGFDSFTELLTWLGSAGSLIIAGMAVAFLLRWNKTWEELLPSNVKKLIVSFIAAMIAAVAIWVQGQPDIVIQIEPYYKWLMLSLSLFVGSQFAYFVAKANSPPK